jgi:cyclohexanecarboxyl-CoA dehydrogenase
MISFSFTPEQNAFAAELRRFAAAELAPRYLDRASSAEFPWQAHRQLAEMGVLGLGLPERFGGSGDPDPITLGLATEALAYGDPNVAAAPVQVGLVAAQLASLAQDAVAERYVPRLISGEIVAAIAVTEPSAGSDAASMTASVRAVPGGWRLSGEKIAITNAACASVALVYARHAGSRGHSGISCFAVDLDSAGVSRSPMPGMGALPLCWGSLAFDDVFVPASSLVGGEGRGFAGVMHHFDFSRPALGLLCLGAAQASLDEAIAWARQREAFGRPIAAFQGVSFPIAEHATWLEARAGCATGRSGCGPAASRTRTWLPCASGGRRRSPRTPSRPPGSPTATSATPRSRLCSRATGTSPVTWSPTGPPPSRSASLPPACSAGSPRNEYAR